MARVLQGDDAAGKLLIDLHYAAVHGYLLGLTEDLEVAADLTQQTFVKAWAALRTYRGEAALRTWLCRIALREYLQWLRARHDGASLESCVGIADPRAARASEAAELRAILRHLPESEQEVFILHHLEGYRCEEIAAALGLSVSNVKFRLFRARKHLKRMLAEEGTEP